MDDPARPAAKDGVIISEADIDAAMQDVQNAVSASSARLPSDIVQKTSRETLKAMQLPEVQKRLALEALFKLIVSVHLISS